MILLFYKLFSFLPLSRKKRKANYLTNLAAWEEYKNTFSNSTYIENQPKLKNFRYGSKYSADYNSCEVIALYNVLVSANKVISYPKLLRHFEANGITCFGAFGTSPFALVKLLNKLNFNTEHYNFTSLFLKKSNEKFIENFQNKHDAFILMSYNTKSIFDMIHTMCITKEGDIYQIHNDYSGSKSYPSLHETIYGYNNNKSRPIILIGVNFPK